jgi:radical SAM superfamily enzyme YgiQ (UPF0313 family)
MLEPLGLEYVAAAFGDRDVIIQDMRIEPDIISTIRIFRPDLVGFTSLTCHVNGIKRLVKKIKEQFPHVAIMVGGQHSTLSPEDFIIPEVDFIIRGDGYAVVHDLLEGHEDLDVVGLTRNKGEYFDATGIRDFGGIETQPFPRRDLVEKYSSNYRYEWFFGVSSIRTSVGCPYGCSFCSVKELSANRFFERSAESVVSELKKIDNRVVYFTDDESMVNSGRMMHMANLIEKEGIKKRYIMWARADTVLGDRELFRRWKKIGLEILMLGYESPSDSRLDKMNKRMSVDMQIRATQYLREMKINFEPLFIIEPDFGVADFTAMKKYVRGQKFFWPGYSILTPFPGSPLYKNLKSQIKLRDLDYYDGAHAVLDTKLPLADFYRHYYELLKDIPLINKIIAILRYPFPKIPYILAAQIAERFKGIHYLISLKKRRDHNV